MKTINISQLFEATQSLTPQDLILDVRTPGEFAAGHIPKAKNIPVDQVMNHVSELKPYQTLYLYCRSGGRVNVAWEILDSLGLKNMVCVVDGGFPDWAEAGYPSEK